MNLGALGIPGSLSYSDLRIWETPMQPLAFSTIFSFPNPAGYTIAFIEPILTCIIPDLGYVPGDEARPIYSNIGATDGLTIGSDATTITISVGASITMPSPKLIPTSASGLTAARWKIGAYICGRAESGALSIPFTNRYAQAFRTSPLLYSATPFGMQFTDGPARRPAVLNPMGRCLASDGGYVPGDVINLFTAAGISSDTMATTWSSGGGLTLAFVGGALVNEVPAAGGATVSLALNKWQFFLTGLA
jgi:hypothetical protein